MEYSYNTDSAKRKNAKTLLSQLETVVGLVVMWNIWKLKINKKM